MRKATIGKFFKSSVMGACILALFFVGSLFIIASGGGGDDSSAPEESAVLTDSNADAAADAVIRAISMAGPSAAIGGIDISAVGTSAENKSPMRSVIDRALGLSRSASAQAQGLAMPFAVEVCADGGTMDVTEPTEQDLLSGSISMTAVYDDCVEGTETVDGTMTIRVVGDLLSLSFTSMTITTSWFHYENTANTENIIMTGYQMITDNMTFNGLNELIAATVTITGDVEGTSDGETLDAGFHRFALHFEETGAGESLTMNGMINTGCILGWATVSTVTAINMPTGQDCPSAGDFSIKSGDNTVRAFVDQSDGLIDVLLNNTPVLQNQLCTDIEGSCI